MGRGPVVGQTMLDHKSIDAISFTGSVATGRRVAMACAGMMRKFQLEMGGKNPLVVLADADLANAVECAVDVRLFRHRAKMYGLVAYHCAGNRSTNVSPICLSSACARW